MHQIVFAAGILCAVSPAAYAFDAADCGAIESQIYTMLDAEFGFEVTQSPTSTMQTLPDGCMVTNLDLYVEDPGIRYTAASASLRGSELMDWVRGDVILPARTALLLEDVAPVSASLPEDLSYLNDITAESLAISASWDGTTQDLVVDEVRIDLGDDNVVSLLVEGRAPEWQPFIMRAEDFGLVALSLDVAFNGLFEQAIAPPIEANGNDLSPESMQFLAAMTSGLLANVSEEIVSTQARAAIVAFLESLPTPRGDLRLSLTNDDPFAPGDIGAEMAAGASLLDAIPDHLTIDADWAPASQ